MKPILQDSERYEIKVQIKLFFSNFAMQLDFKSEMCVCVCVSLKSHTLILKSSHLPCF